MNQPSFPTAPDVQKRLSRVRQHLLDEFEAIDAAAIKEAIDILEVVKRIDGFTTLPASDNLCPPLPGL